MRHFTYHSVLSAGFYIFIYFHILAAHPHQATPGFRIIISPLSQNLDTHPIIYHQQHVNRGSQRLARMTGRAFIPDAQLLDAIYQRIDVLPEPVRDHFNLTDPIPYAFPYHDGRVARQLSTTQRNNATPNMNPPTPSCKRPTFTSKHSVPLKIQSDDIGYIGSILIGTPPRPFRLLMDSGSADTWVGAEVCQADGGGGCGNHTFLGPSSSSSFNDTLQNWTIDYARGSVSGHIVHDDIALGGFKLRAFKFGAANTESAEFTPDEIPFDGILGLAKSLTSHQQTPTFVEALWTMKLIQKAIVAYRLPRRADGEADGELMIGALDLAMYNPGSLITVKNVNPHGFWELPIDRIRVDGRGFEWSSRTGILDTGTTLIIAPKADVDAVHGFIPGARSDGVSWTIPCTTTVSLSLTIGGSEFPLDPRDLAFQPLDPAKPSGECTSGISSGTVGGGTEWLLGDVFLKNVYLGTHAANGNDKIYVARLAK